MARMSRTTNGRIGPNAIIQTITALRELRGIEEADRLLDAWGHGDLRRELPSGMVDERAVGRLCASVVKELGDADGRAVLDCAGAKTGAYLLRNRIPVAAKFLLPWLPDRLALKILFAAISRHAWTFAGTGHFSADLKLPGFEIAGCPICRDLRCEAPVCAFYRSTFETLLRALIHPRVTVTESECSAVKGPRCRFTIQLPA